MPWQPKAGAPEGVTKSLALAAIVWFDAPAWLIGMIPAINSGMEYVNLASFCAAGPPPQLESPWHAGGLLMPNSIPEYAEAKLDEHLFSYYCEFPTASGFTCDLISTATLTAGQSDLYLPPYGGGHYAEIGNYTHLKVVSLDPGTLDTGFDGFDYTNDVNNGSIFSGRFNSTTPQHDETLFHTGATRWVIRFHDVTGPGRIEVYECNVGGASYTPAPVAPAPAGFIGPVAGSYPDLESVGKALDYLLIFAQNMNSRLRTLFDQVSPTAHLTVGETVAMNSGDTVNMPFGTIGVIVTMFNLPLSTDEMFGGPPKLHGAGWVTFGDLEGWCVPQQLEVSPQLILPIPNGATKLSVTLRTPTTASVSWLRPAGGGA